MKSLLPIGLVGLACLAASSAATGCGSRPPGFGAGGSDDASPSLGPEGDDSGSLAPSPSPGSPQGSFSSGSGGSTGPSLGDAGCATATAVAKRQPAYLLFVLDGSGSMKQQNKWTAVVPALEDIFGQMETAADTGVAAGLVVFSDTNDSTMGAGPYPGSTDVSIAFVSAAQQMALDNRLSGMPMNSTPTESALTGGYGELEGFQAQAPLQSGGKKVLVLITDGVPTDGCMSTPGDHRLRDESMHRARRPEAGGSGPEGPDRDVRHRGRRLRERGWLLRGQRHRSELPREPRAGRRDGPRQVQSERDHDDQRPLLLRDRSVDVAHRGPAPDAVRDGARHDPRPGHLVHVPDPVERPRDRSIRCA